jgi:hypothetical protein
MSDRELGRIIGSCSLDDVGEAFTLVHEERPEYTSDVVVTLWCDRVQIDGEIRYLGSKVGYFERRLLYTKGFPQARHEIIELEVEHRDRDVAKFHLTRVIRFYDSTGIRFVRLDAGGDGVWIWPAFGFDLRKFKHKQRLRKIALEKGFPSVADAGGLYAPDIVTSTLNGVTVGADCMKELHRLEDEDIPMVLDLQDETHRNFLRNSGILRVEESS